MRRATLVGLVVMLALGQSTRLLAMGGDYPDGEISTVHSDWPKGLTELINDPARVAGHWVNSNDFFYYQDDASAFNVFAEQYSLLPDTDPVVIIHLGTPRIGPLGGHASFGSVLPFGDPATEAYNWRLVIIRRGWGAPKDPRRPEDDPGYVVTLHVWIGSDIPLERLDIPKHVEVRSAGEIEQFIEHHRDEFMH